MRDLYPDPPDYAEPLDEVRSAGLRRLSRLTWRATQLGALATVGIATVFARTAPAQTGSQAAPVATPATPAPSQAAAPAAGHAKSHQAAAPTARSSIKAGPGSSATTTPTSDTAAPTAVGTKDAP